jgi:hypothetical protein
MRIRSGFSSFALWIASFAVVARDDLVAGLGQHVVQTCRSVGESSTMRILRIAMSYLYFAQQIARRCAARASVGRTTLRRRTVDVRGDRLERLSLVNGLVRY